MNLVEAFVIQSEARRPRKSRGGMNDMRGVINSLTSSETRRDILSYVFSNHPQDEHR